MTAKLYSPGASPFVAKAAMVAKLSGIDVEMVAGDVAGGDPAIDAANPLSKIPCLVLDDGFAVYDSRTITRYLDRTGSGNLFPATDPDLLKAERMEALCDGVCDCLVGSMYEHRMRPENFVYQGWIDRLWGKAERGLDALANDPPPAGEDRHIGSVALYALVGYLNLRFAGKWENGREALISWAAEFEAAHPELADLKPTA